MEKSNSKPRMRRGISHFLSLPFTLSKSATQNHAALLSGLPKEYHPHIYHKQLHITLLVLNIHSEDQKMRTFALLDQLRPSIRQLIATAQAHSTGPDTTGALSPTLSTLDYFSFGKKRDPAKCKVVYANVREEWMRRLTNEVLDLVVRALLREDLIPKKNLWNTEICPKTGEFSLPHIHVTLLKVLRRGRGGMDLAKVLGPLGEQFELGEVSCDRLALRRMDEHHTIDWQMTFEAEK